VVRSAIWLIHAHGHFLVSIFPSSPSTIQIQFRNDPAISRFLPRSWASGRDSRRSKGFAVGSSVSTAVERDCRRHSTRDILCSLTSHFEGAAYKAADGLGANGKGIPATEIRHVGLPTVRSWRARLAI
jgi:hypothetical protein